MTELPKEIVDLIYRASCCVDSPQQAAGQACSCVAAHIVEQVEEWAETLYEQRRDAERLANASFRHWAEDNGQFP